MVDVVVSLNSWEDRAEVDSVWGRKCAVEGAEAERGT
jgi:hypothetical protein